MLGKNNLFLGRIGYRRRRFTGTEGQRRIATGWGYTNISLHFLVQCAAEVGTIHREHTRPVGTHFNV